MAFGSELGDQHLERQVLVSVSTGCHVAHALEQSGKRGIARKIEAQGKRIDEKPDQSFQFATGTVGDGSADHQVGLAL